VCFSIKILNIQPFDYFGSIQRRSLQVALRLRRKGIITIFLIPETTESERNFSNQVIKHGFRAFRTGALRPVIVNDLSSLKRNINWLLSFPKTLVRLYKILKLEKAKGVLINGLVCVQEAIVVGFFCRKKGLWVLISDLYPRFVVLSLLPLIRLIDKRVFVSKKSINFYLGKASDVIIPESVDRTVFDPTSIRSSEKKELLKTFDLENFFPLVISVANISQVKGFEYLIEGLVIVKQHFPAIKLLIVGNVPFFQWRYYLNLRNLVRNLSLDQNVVFVGHVNHEKLPAFLSIADLFVLPSINEGTPVSILEAMAMEKAVVSTNVGGISEQVVDGETGIIVPSKDPETLAKAIVSLLDDEAKRQSMGQKGRKNVAKVFSIDRCALEYERLYKELSRFNQ
jgi:glycosyltransferase involved in cell wall biosynthesis